MIRVLHNYGGARTGEQRILPGNYADNAPELMGLADYLVKNGHAERIADPPKQTVIEPEETPTEPEDEPTPIRKRSRKS